MWWLKSIVSFNMRKLTKITSSFKVVLKSNISDDGQQPSTFIFLLNLSYTPYFHCCRYGLRYSLWMIGLTNRTLIGLHKKKLKFWVAGRSTIRDDKSWIRIG